MGWIQYNEKDNNGYIRGQNLLLALSATLGISQHTLHFVCWHNKSAAMTVLSNLHKSVYGH